METLTIELDLIDVLEGRYIRGMIYGGKLFDSRSSRAFEQYCRTKKSAPCTMSFKTDKKPEEFARRLSKDYRGRGFFNNEGLMASFTIDKHLVGLLADDFSHRRGAFVEMNN